MKLVLYTLFAIAFFYPGNGFAKGKILSVHALKRLNALELRLQGLREVRDQYLKDNLKINEVDTAEVKRYKKMRQAELLATLDTIKEVEMQKTEIEVIGAETSRTVAGRREEL